MNVYEMEGFLRGKCLPGDMKVNESDAQYLVRKFSEFESKISESKREFRSADATIHNLELKLTDMAVQLANAESKCRELASGHWPRLQEQDINALMRFNETCEDGEEYDIGAEAMARLVEIGLAGKGPHGIRNITPFGQWVINAREGEVDFEPLKTEEDNIAESALRMAQLRTGAAQ
ncbi:hypothetical protein FW706_05230 [Salmonella enterica subsp. enterica serovar Gatuni]|nr:hypothetical protein [Salmonella enterica subsp. enterica serovar Gatuni]